MSFPYKELLTPYRLSDTIVLKNRLISPNSLHGLMQGPEDFPSESTINECTQFCQSGASLFSARHHMKPHGGGAVGDRAWGDEKDRSHIPIWDLNNPGVQNYMCHIPYMAKMYGSKVLIKLEPAFPSGYNFGGVDAKIKFPPKAKTGNVFHNPSSDKTDLLKMGTAVPKELLPGVIDEVVQILKKYKSWGFSGLNIRIDRCIDASMNDRTDEYGGSLENRCRFVIELFKAVKSELGKDFLIEGAMPGIHLHGDSGELPYGYDLNDTVEFARMTEGLIDILTIREGSGVDYQCTHYNCREKTHNTLDYCRAIKDAGVKTTLAANTNFNDPDDMEEAIRSGACDLISAGRAFIAEPQFTKKLYSFNTEKPTPCLLCNKCHGIMHAPWMAICSVNPQIGIAHRLPTIEKPAFKRKNVAVIGGGPIGMRTACFAAEKGHNVTLYEQSDKLGGKMLHGDLYSFKWTFKRYRLWLMDELARRNVKVILNCRPDPEELAGQGFDAVIACTGSVAVKPPVEGADNDLVYKIDDVYENRIPEIGQRVAVVGGSEAAVETAMYIAGQLGRDVTVITRKKILAEEGMRPHGIHMQFIEIDEELGYGNVIPAWGQMKNLKGITLAATTKVTPTSVTYEKDGKLHTLECDSVIVNGGHKKCQEEALRYASCAPEFYLAGDVEDCCNNLQEGNVSAYGRASML